jgi:hypothetical protein
VSLTIFERQNDPLKHHIERSRKHNIALIIYRSFEILLIEVKINDVFNKKMHKFLIFAIYLKILNFFENLPENLYNII